MIVEVANSPDDPRLQVYRDLKRTNLTRWSGLFIAEGDKVVDRLLTSGLTLHSVLVGRGWLTRYESRVPPEVPLLVVDDRQVPELVGFEFHRGVLACGQRPQTAELAELIPGDKPHCTLVICPNVQGPDNLGNILRTSAALGVDGVLVGNESADPFSRRVLRVSMGELLRLPLRQSADLAADLRALRREFGVELLATVLDEQAEPMDRLLTRPPRLGVLFGGEGNGLPAAIVAECDRRLTIPMARGVDSMNVAITAGIVIYELTRRGRPPTS